MASFSCKDVLEKCQKYGPNLHVPAPLEGPRVMWAIAGNESSFGANCGPRHESSYDTGGSTWERSDLQKSLVLKYGSDAACSFGPWQMMYINFSGADTPTQLTTDLDALAVEFVRFFNKFVIQIRHAETLQEIGMVWNSGHISEEPSPVVAAYCTKLQNNYNASN